MTWTEEQGRAIRLDGRSLIVSAAAGSGKTAVLVERLLRILSDTKNRVRADSIIVVTFTNDAAAQMKQRLSAKLSERLLALAGSDDMDAYDWLTEQRAGLSSAKISTISSFCFDLIRENAELLGISPQFSVAEPSQESLYQARAVSKVMERWSRECVEALNTLFGYFCTREDKELEKIVLGTAEYLDSIAFRDKWIADARRLAADREALFRSLRRDAAERLEALLPIVQETLPTAEAVCDEKENKFLAKTQADLEKIRNAIQWLNSVTSGKAAGEAKANLPNLGSKPNKNYLEKMAGKLDETGMAVCLARWDLYNSCYKDIRTEFTGLLKFYEEDFEVQRRIIPPLLDLTEEYLETLLKEKISRNVLSFSDGEELALRLLGSMSEDGILTRSPLAETLSQQYRLIMVDEYQDSNNKQDCLFKLLSHGAVIDEKGLHYGDNAFLVGDVKQSIYTFRKANPENFTRIFEEAEDVTETESHALGRIRLNRNFRSADGVLDFVNHLFCAVMTVRCGQVLYCGGEELVPGSPVYEQTPPDRTRLLIPRIPEELQPEQASEDIQAECIADTVLSMLRDPEAVVYLPEGKTRPCREEDFCILLRSVTGKGGPIAEALQRRGLRVNSDAGSGLLARPEIRLIADLLRVLNNPMADAPMAAVLLSPIFGFTADTLAKMKIYGRRSRLYLQLISISGNDKLEEVEPALRKQCTGVLEMLREMREAAAELPLEAGIQEICRICDLYSLQSIYEDAAPRRENLNTFCTAAKTYRENADLTSQSSLGGWVRYLDRLAENKKELEVSGGQGNTAGVTIKTIHGSKGLEYPFVILAHPESKFSRQTSYEPLLASEEGLMGFHIYDREKLMQSTTMTFQYLLADAYRKQTSEEMRLLYVALTRARQELMIVLDAGKTAALVKKHEDILKNAPETAALLAEQAGSMLDWITDSLLADPTEAAALKNAILNGISSQTHCAAYSVWSGCRASAAEEPLSVNADAPAPPDAEALALMRSQLGRTFRSERAELVSKYSVTQLAHPGSLHAVSLREPEFRQDKSDGTPRPLRGKARGTAVHKMLQFMDFEQAAQDPAAELSRLLQNGSLNEAEAEAIPAEKLAEFFASDLYRRIAASKEVLKEKNIFVQIADLALPEGSALAAQYAGTDGVMIGQMDLIFREADGWVLVDYKTDYAASPEPLLREYALQLGLYQKAAERSFGEPVKEAYLYSFALGRAIPVDLDKIVFGGEA